jgi:hypothetical protein
VPAEIVKNTSADVTVIQTSAERLAGVRHRRGPRLRRVVAAGDEAR